MAGSNRSRSGSSRSGGGQAVASNRSARIQELSRSLNNKVNDLSFAKAPKGAKASREFYAEREKKLRQYNAVMERNRLEAGYGGPKGGKGSRAAARALEMKSGARRIRYGAGLNAIRSGGYRLGGSQIGARRMKGVINRRSEI